MTFAKLFNLVMAAIWCLLAAYYTDRGDYGGTVRFGMIAMLFMTIAIVDAIEGRRKNKETVMTDDELKERLASNTLDETTEIIGDTWGYVDGARMHFLRNDGIHLRLFFNGEDVTERCRDASDRGGYVRLYEKTQVELKSGHVEFKRQL